MGQYMDVVINAQPVLIMIYVESVRGKGFILIIICIHLMNLVHGVTRVIMEGFYLVFCLVYLGPFRGLEDILEFGAIQDKEVVRDSIVDLNRIVQVDILVVQIALTKQ